MASLQESIEDVVAEFDLFTDWQEKYAHLIELGRSLPPMDPAFKNDQHRVRGCQSQVWLHVEAKEDRLHVEAESDALIVQGLIALLLSVYQDRSARELKDADLAFMERIGLLSHLSMNRTNGLQSMVQALRAHALAHVG